MTDFEWNLVESAIAIVGLLIVRLIARKIIKRRLSSANFSIQRKKITFKAINMLYILVLIVAITGIWGLNGKQVLTFVTSVLTVLGVGFFAQWSLLSNITSGLLLYFNHPMKIGDYISIVDKDFPLSGVVEDISLFFLFVRDDTGVVYTLPNTLVMQKTLTLSKDRTPIATATTEELKEDASKDLPV